MSITLIGQRRFYLSNQQYFSTAQGLSHQDVQCVVTDQRGVAWVATRSGLNRFDGKNFRVYTVEDGLRSNTIHTIHVVGDVLWCLHRSQITGKMVDLSLFHTITEQVISFEDYSGIAFPFELADLASIDYVPETGNIVLIEQGVAVHTFSLEQGFQKARALAPNQVCVGDPTRTHYCYTKQPEPTFQRIDPDGQILFSLTVPVMKDEVFFYPIAITATGDLYFTYTDDQCHYPIMKVCKDGQLEELSRIEVQLLERSAGFGVDCTYITALQYLPHIDAISFVSLNTFFVFSTNGDLLLATELAEDKTDYIRLVGGDQKGSTFWASGGSGLHQIALTENNFTNLLHNQGMQEFRGITGVGNAIYFNSYNGFIRYDKVEKRMRQVSNGGVGCIYDEQYGIWVNSGGYLFQLDTAGAIIQSNFVPASHESWAMLLEGQRLWFSWRGIHFFDVETKETGEMEYHQLEELKDATVYHFYRLDEQNVLLCATTGLYQWNINNGIQTCLIPGIDFRHLYHDESDGTYWLATGQEGLLHWNPATGESERFQLHRSQSNTIHAVYADAYGYLWLSTENGIFQFNKKTTSFRAYYPKDGTSTNEFNRSSHFQDADGTIYFGSINGITSFHPKDFQAADEHMSNAKVVVLEVHQYMGRSEQLENVTQQYHQEGQLQMHASDRSLSITLTLDDYSQNSNTLYFYRLKGMDEEWIPLDGNTVRLSGLPHGRQQVELKASLLNGYYSPVLAIPIRVHPPFYISWWFLILSGLAIGAGTFLMTRWRTIRLKQQKEILQQEVLKRTETITLQAEKLKELDQAKSRFFANVSHELRTPITLIQGPVQSVLKNQQLDPRNHKLLGRAVQNTKQLTKLVNEILDMTKLEANKLELHETEVVLYPLLRRYIANFQSLADNKNITLSFEYQPSKTLQLLLDEDKFGKIINNLLSNALKFTAKDGQVHILVEDQGQYLCLQVQDSGRGIPKADLAYIFDRFYQSSGNKKAEGGLGIGLAFSKELTQLMQGQIWAESEEGKGATFHVQLPKKEVMNMLSDEAQLALTTAIAPSPKPDLIAPSESTIAKEHTILIVEDNRDLIDFLQFILQPFHHVLLAENGAVALELLEKHQGRPPSLILSDLMMPVMDGFELAAQLKAHPRWRSLPLIMLTARAEAKDKLKALRIGVDDYLIKPFDEEELLVRIANLLNNYEERQAFREIAEVEATTTTEPSMTISEETIWLQQVEGFIIEQMQSPLFSVDYLADQLNLNRRTLYRKLKAHTGLTPNHYIRAIRLKVAKDLLETGQCESVKAVALQVGFKQATYFSNLYKKEFGKLPSSFFE
ncbi:MAG: ATP-binding protein [Bacteroidota bacterium]